MPLTIAIKDFEVVSIFAVTAPSIAVYPAAPARTLQELIAYAKANPGKLQLRACRRRARSATSPAKCSSNLPAGSIFSVPYKGMGPAQADVISGQVAMFLPNITGQVIELHRTGRIRILAVGCAVRATRRCRRSRPPSKAASPA